MSILKSEGVFYGGLFGFLTIWTLKMVSDKYSTLYCLPSPEKPPEITGKDIETLGEFRGHQQWSNYHRYQCDEIANQSSLHEKPSLKCYRSFINGIFPVYIEVMNRGPLVVIFRQGLDVAAAQAVVAWASENATNATVDNHGVGGVDSPSRVVRGTWVDLQAQAKAISQRLEALSGFNHIGFEKSQILFYKKGGHYAPHYDYFPEADVLTWWEKLLLLPADLGNVYGQVKPCFLQKFSSNLFCAWSQSKAGVRHWWNRRILEAKPNMIADAGNRIASLLASVQTPEKGGGTMFPKLNLTLIPNSGDVLLWFNMLPNQTMEDHSFHSGCPVVEGNKTAMVVWVREKGQELRMRCPREEQQSYWIKDFMTGAFRRVQA